MSGDLRDRLAAAIRAAATDCPAGCDCEFPVPILATTVSDGQIRYVEGSPEALADAVMAELGRDTGPLREQLVAGLNSERWGSKHPAIGEHGQHGFYAPCGICRGDVPAIVALALHIVEPAMLQAEVAACEDGDATFAQMQTALDAERDRAEQTEAAVQRVRAIPRQPPARSARWRHGWQEAREAIDRALDQPKETPDV